MSKLQDLVQDLDKCAEDVDTAPLIRVSFDLAAIFRAARAQGTLTSSSVTLFAQYINDLLCEDPRVPASKLIYAEESNFYYSKLECWIVEKYAYSLIAQDLASNSVLNGAKKEFQLRDAWTDPLPMKISELPERYIDYKEEYRIGYQHYTLFIAIISFGVLSVLYYEWMLRSVLPVLYLCFPGILLAIMFVTQECGYSIVDLIEHYLEKASSYLNLGERLGLNANTIVYVEYTVLCFLVAYQCHMLYPQCILEKSVATTQDTYSYLYSYLFPETSEEKVFTTSMLLLVWKFFTLENMTPLLLILTAIKYIFHLQPHCLIDTRLMQYFTALSILQRLCSIVIKYGFTDMEMLALKDIDFAEMDDKGTLIIDFLDSLNWQSIHDSISGTNDTMMVDEHNDTMNSRLLAMQYDGGWLFGYSIALLTLLNSKNMKEGIDNFFIRLFDIQHLVVFVVCVYPFFIEDFAYTWNEDSIKA